MENKFLTMNIKELQAEAERLKQTSGWRQELALIDTLIQSELEFGSIIDDNI